jgi:hypothetical protein
MLNRGKSLMYKAGIWGPMISKTERGEFGTKVNLNEKESFELMPPHRPSVEPEIPQSKRIAVLYLRKEQIKTVVRKPLLDAFQLVVIS